MHERERQKTGTIRERGRGRESARACVRAAFGALGNDDDPFIVLTETKISSVPAATLSARKGGGEREFIGPCSLLMVARAHSHTNTLRTHAQMTRAAAAATMHKDTSLAHRLTDVALALHALD